MTSGEQGGNGPNAPVRDVPVDWEALEDAFENNAPEVHSYLHLGTGEVLRVVDGIADPEMHSRIAADSNYMRIDPVSSREQYRWMERFIQMVDEPDLRDALTNAIDGKGAFRRFKDALMAHGTQRERWFAFRSERLRVFMEAWMSAHALRPIARPVWPAQDSTKEPPAASTSEATTGRRGRSADTLRKQLRDLAHTLGARDLDKVLTFAEFVKTRRARTHASRPETPPDSAQDSKPDTGDVTEEDPPSSRRRSASQ